MTQYSPVLDWSGQRGDRWRAQLSGMEAMLEPVNTPLVQALKLKVPCRIADLGCGGGATSLELLKTAPEGSAVTGFDISPSLLEAARSRLPEGKTQLSFEHANLETAKPPNGPYDRLCSRFGLMFFQEPKAAFSNLANWLTPGGRFAFAVWGPPADNPWMSTLRDLVTELATLPPPAFDAPGPFRYEDPGRLTALLDAAGFVEIEAECVETELPIGGQLSPKEATEFAFAAFSSFADQLAEAGADAQSEAHQRLLQEFARHHRNGAVWMNASVHVFTGTRSA